jgi:hypothetical protein
MYLTLFRLLTYPIDRGRSFSKVPRSLPEAFARRSAVPTTSHATRGTRRHTSLLVGIYGTDMTAVPTARTKTRAKVQSPSTYREGTFLKRLGNPPHATSSSSPPSPPLLPLSSSLLSSPPTSPEPDAIPEPPASPLSSTAAGRPSKRLIRSR